MSTEFIFDGESLTLATEEEMRAAILYGRLVSRKDGLSTYAYRGRKFILSDHDLTPLTPDPQP